MTQSERPCLTLAAHPLQRHRRWQPIDPRLVSGEQPYTQGALALTYPMPSGLDAEPGPAVLSVVEASPGPSRPTIPAPDTWAARFLQAVVEVVSSDRPLPQLARWTDHRVFAEVSQRRQRVAIQRTATQARVGRQHVATVHVSRPTLAVAEVAARITVGPRSRAIAARLEFQRGRWLCTALDFG